MATTFTWVYGTSADDPMRKYDGKACEIVRPLTDDECDPECQPMYRVRFADGAERDAFADEIAA